MATQFLREESFSNKGGKPGRKGKAKRKPSKKRRFSASEILAELMRVEANCNHVLQPQPPLLIAGETKSIRKGIAYPKRWDTRVLLGAVASWPERWDQCDPTQVAEWTIAVREYAEALWGSKVAAIVMHVDEAHPHLHIILHDRGNSVKPFSPGFAAGDAAYDAALAVGVSPMDANRVRHAEYKRAEALWLDHYHLHVGARFGMARTSLTPRPRGPRVSALELRAVREWDDPVDPALAATNVQLVSQLLASEIKRPLPKPTGRTVAVLPSIGFVPEVDYHALAERLREEEDVAKDLHPAAVPIQRLLLEILAAKPGWLEFVRECHARELELIFRRSGSEVVGITFRKAGRGFPGSKLGRRFSWPRLSLELGFDPSDAAHMAALTEADLRANTPGIVLERLDGEGSEHAAAAKRRRYPRPVSLVPNQAAAGTLYCWASGRPAVIERERSLVVVDTAPDVIAFAIVTALRRGWTAVRLSGPAKVLKRCVDFAQKVANDLGVSLVLPTEDQLGTLAPRKGAGAPRRIASDPLVHGSHTAAPGAGVADEGLTGKRRRPR